MIDSIIHIVGFIILWMATDIGRKEESKVEMFTTNWWFIFLLITFGSVLIGINR